MLLPISAAIAYAHRQGILHRVLTPGNVLLDRQRQPWVSDFGLARQMNLDSDLTRSGQVLGTPRYMSPEQARGRVAEIGVTTDVYALGALLYYLLTARPPFHAATAVAICGMVVTQAQLRSLAARALGGWDLRQVARLDTPHLVGALVFSPDAKRLAIAARLDDQQITIHLIDPATGERLRELQADVTAERADNLAREVERFTPAFRLAAFCPRRPWAGSRHAPGVDLPVGHAVGTGGVVLEENRIQELLIGGTAPGGPSGFRRAAICGCGCPPRRFALSVRRDRPGCGVGLALQRHDSRGRRGPVPSRSRRRHGRRPIVARGGSWRSNVDWAGASSTERESGRL